LEKNDQDAFRNLLPAILFDTSLFGMYDVQIVNDVNIVLDVLNGEINREREWMV
jgi:hypothetical protein